MRSKTSYFNKTVFLKNITGYWPLWAAYLLIWLLIMPVSIGQSLSYGWFSSGSALNNLRSNIFDIAGVGGTVMSLIFGAFTAMAVYSYMFNQKSTGMMHSLPIKREGLFLSNYLSGLCFMIVPNIIVFLITLVVEAAGGLLDVGSLLTWLAVTSMLNVFFFSLAALCANLTGLTLVLPVVYAILNFVVVAAEYLFQAIFQQLAFGSTSIFADLSFLTWLSPPLKLLENSQTTRLINDGDIYNFANWNAVIVYFIAGIVIAVLAMLIYRRRRSEAAGDVVAVRHLKPVFKYCMAFGFAISLGLLLYTMFKGQSYGLGSTLIMLVCLLFAGMIGYYASEMLMRKSLRVFKGTLPGLLCFFAIAAILVFMVEFDIFGYEKRIPGKGNIEAVSLTSYSGYYYGSTPYSDDADLIMRLHAAIVADKASLEKESTKGYVYDDEGMFQLYGKCTVRITYTLTNGKLVLRSYELPVSPGLLSDSSSLASMLDTLLNSKETTENRYALPQDSTIVGGTVNASNYEMNLSLNQSDAQLLHEAITEDIEAGRLGKVFLLQGEAYYNETLDVSIAIDYTYPNPNYAEQVTSVYSSASSYYTDQTIVSSMNYSVNINSESTIAALKELGFDESRLITLYEQSMIERSIYSEYYGKRY